jgi:hypothetical protein
MIKNAMKNVARIERSENTGRDIYFEIIISTLNLVLMTS